MQQQFVWLWGTRSGVSTGDARAFTEIMADSLGWGLKPWKIYWVTNEGLEEVRLFAVHVAVGNGFQTTTYEVRRDPHVLLQFVVVRESDATVSRVDCPGS